MGESRAEFEASQKALEAAEEALQEQVADNERLGDALEGKVGEVAELEGKLKQLAAEAQALQSESCRCDPP